MVPGPHGEFGGTCYVTCGGGKQSRARTCTDPQPQNGGLDCVGASSEMADCNSQACPTVAAGTYQQLCPVGWFTCQSGGITCIDESFKCDCANNCDDGSDEDSTYASCSQTLSATCGNTAGYLKSSWVITAVGLLLTAILVIRSP